MVRSTLSTDGDVAASDIRDYLTLCFENPGSEPLNLTAHLRCAPSARRGRPSARLRATAT
jgi:hypothetical protein